MEYTSSNMESRPLIPTPSSLSPPSYTDINNTANYGSAESSGSGSGLALTKEQASSSTQTTTTTTAQSKFKKKMYMKITTTEMNTVRNLLIDKINNKRHVIYRPVTPCCFCFSYGGEKITSIYVQHVVDGINTTNINICNNDLVFHITSPDNFHWYDMYEIIEHDMSKVISRILSTQVLKTHEFKVVICVEQDK